MRLFFSVFQNILKTVIGRTTDLPQAPGTGAEGLLGPRAFEGRVARPAGPAHRVLRGHARGRGEARAGRPGLSSSPGRPGAEGRWGKRLRPFGCSGSVTGGWEGELGGGGWF